MLREGVVSALLACGHEVVDLGLASSPVVQHAIRRYDGAGGISISASHNTAEWNALRFFGPKGTYLSTAESNELLDIYHLRKFRFLDWTGVGRLRMDDNPIDPYLDAVAAVFDLEPLKKLRVVVDCCNGTSSPILKRLNERFGFNLILINDRLDGRHFAHDPVISANTIGLQLAPLMKPLNADVGFQFDVDSDRVGVATDKGQAVSEELILPLIADYLLPRAPGKFVITNLSSTALLEHVAAPHGGKVIRVPVGRQATIDALSGYRPEQIAGCGRGHRRRHDAPVRVHLRWHRVHAGHPLDGRDPKSASRRDHRSISSVLHAQSRGPAHLAPYPLNCSQGFRSNTRMARRTCRMDCGSIGLTAGSTCGSARPSRYCASSASNVGSRRRTSSNL
jgi:phosphomannomutase